MYNIFKTRSGIIVVGQHDGVGVKFLLAMFQAGDKATTMVRVLF